MSKGYTLKEYYDFESLSVLKEVKGKGMQHRYTNEHGNDETDTNLLLTDSMLISKAYKDLTPRQRQLYTVAKAQFFGARRRPSRDFPEIDKYKALDGKLYFYLNFKLLTDRYALYKPKDTKGVYADIRALIAHGFIERDSDGKKPNEQGQHESAIYKYSGKWKEWKPPAK